MSEALIAVVGPTGTGKSELAMALAEILNGEIVSVDSAQVFRGLDVGTAKATKAEQERVRHHLIDVLEPDEQWTAADFSSAADVAIEEIRGRGKTPILCGGTGLWLRALVHGLVEVPPIDPEIRASIRAELAEEGVERMHEELRRVDPVAASRIESRDPQRIGRALEVYRQSGLRISELQDAHRFREERHRLMSVGIEWPKDLLAQRLALRARRMYEGGLLEETERCLSAGFSRNAPGLGTIGYRDAVAHLLDGVGLEEAIQRTEIATRQYAKRQRNWFRGDGTIRWVPPGAPASLVLQELRLGRGTV